MPPVTRSCESTMLIDCPTAMSVSYSRLPAKRVLAPSVSSAALFQNPSPFFENGSGPLRSADDIARQRMVLPVKRGGGIDNHPRIRVQLALIRRDGHVDAATLGVLDDLHAALRIAAGQDRPNDVLNIRDVHMVIDHNCEPVHLDPAGALRCDQPRLLGMADILSLQRHDRHQTVAALGWAPDSAYSWHSGLFQLIPDHTGAQISQKAIVFMRRLALGAT